MVGMDRERAETEWEPKLAASDLQNSTELQGRDIVLCRISVLAHTKLGGPNCACPG